MTEQGVFTRFGAYDFTKDDRFQSGLDKLKENNEGKIDDLWLLRTKLFYYNKFIEPICIQDYLNAVHKEDEGKDVSRHSDALTSLAENVSHCHLTGDMSMSTNVTLDNATSSNISTHLAEVSQSTVKNKADNVSLSQDCNTHVKTSNVQDVSCSKQFRDELSHVSSAIISDDIITDLAKSMVKPSSYAESEDNCNRNVTNKNNAIQEQEDYEGEQHLTFAQIMDYIQRGEKIPGLKDLDIKPTNLQPTESVITRKAKPWENTIIQ